MKILFLDIDGVLNGHQYDPLAESCKILPECVTRLNRVLDKTGCMIVLSSAWRYMILGGAMTLSGFSYLLRTHGVRKDCLLGTTRRDDQTEDPEERGRQIQEWVRERKPSQFAIVDDLDLGFAGMPFVRTDSKIGMTDADADRLIQLLN